MNNPLPEAFHSLQEEASNPETSPERLTELYQDYSQIEISTALVSNPNTPAEILWQLGEKFPRELLVNPVFDLMLLENPNFLADMPAATLIRILGLPDIEEDYVILVLNHCQRADVLATIVSNYTQLWNRWRQVHYLFHPNLVGAKLMGADLRGANLEGVHLLEANLEGANLEGANLEGAYLCGTNLERVNLRATKFNANTKITEKWRLVWELVNHPTSGRDLRGADLVMAYLVMTNLEGTNLEGANLERANLDRANLDRANLERANLREAYLRGVNLEGANLHGANLEGAYLVGADLRGAYLVGANLDEKWRLH